MVPISANVLRKMAVIWTAITLSWRFGAIGKRPIIRKPLLLTGLRHVVVGDFLAVRQGFRLEMVERHGRVPQMSIGDRVNIEQNVHIACHSRVMIGNDVSIAANSAIVDVTHPFESGDEVKIGDRVLDEDSFVDIGDRCVIGFGAVVLPNVRLGEGCFVGANSVVTKSFPARSVVAGSPAKLIRSY